MNIHEAELIHFIVKEKKERIIESFDNPKRRKKVMGEIAHKRFFLNDNYVYSIPRNINSNELLYKYLVNAGAPGECYIISAGVLDGMNMELTEAVATIHGHQINTIISCIPGKLLYFEGENPDDRYLVKRA